MSANAKLRAYLTAHIHLSAKYPLATLTDEELAHIAVLCDGCRVSFDDWSRIIYGEDKPASSNGYIDPNDLSEEDIEAINSKALDQLKRMN